MQITKTKIPEGLTSIAKMMGMEKEEVRMWPYYNELRSMFKAYNLGVMDKARLIEGLTNISVKCAEDEIYYFSTGVDKAITAIRVFY